MLPQSPITVEFRPTCAGPSVRVLSADGPQEAWLFGSCMGAAEQNK